MKNTSTKAKLEAKYGLGDRGFLYVEKLLKGKIHEGTCKDKSYEKRNLQYQQNTLFKNDQKQLTVNLVKKANQYRMHQTQRRPLHSGVESGKIQLNTTGRQSGSRRSNKILLMLSSRRILLLVWRR